MINFADDNAKNQFKGVFFMYYTYFQVKLLRMYKPCFSSLLNTRNTNYLGNKLRKIFQTQSSLANLGHCPAWTRCHPVS